MTDGPFGSNLKSAHYTDSGARVFRLQNVGDGEFRDERAYVSLDHFETLRSHEAIAGDLLLASLGETLPRVAIVPKLEEPAIVKADVIRARLHPEVLTKWVYYALLAPRTRFHTASLIKGVGRPRLGMAAMKEIPIPLPPLAEQHRIVEALEEQLSRINQARMSVATALGRAISLRDTLVERAVRGSAGDVMAGESEMPLDEIRAMTRGMAGKHWKPTDPIQLPNMEVPEGWALASLGDLAWKNGYGTSIKCDYEGAGPAVLRIPNVQGGFIDVGDLKYAVNADVDLSEYYVRKGDVLFVRTNGSPALIGRTGVVERDMDRAFASYLIRFRMNTELVEPKWIQLVTRSRLWRRHIEKVAASSAGQYNLNSKHLAELPVPLPPLSVQFEILERVNSELSWIERLQSASGVVIRRSERLRARLLDEAFLGRLVRQDAADESASVLLARISAERSRQVGVKRTRKVTAKKHDAARATARTGFAPEPTPAPALAVQQEFDL
ncbi:restriction endonuclease subunit S [Streptomyces sp. MBT62]|uniref:restriction endonuclease subunit S n=1 Tax=Streptomyces sp. MBT62 TaxID=2800410 RepID=UPI00190A66EB|nr:restriction endonuclease subunit S [Streptomyces sp. MBT62]MBK3568118.1 restriction endonuclease subunit S [Streptomyces sp. MBT62]